MSLHNPDIPQAPASPSLKPIVAIVGRPNVGKSTLFNRLTKGREAVVSEIPGTTRDRIFGDVDWDGLAFTLVDTGGLEGPDEDPLKEKVQSQVFAALTEADLVIFVLDAIHGLAPLDFQIADRLRRLDKPVVTVVNKVDNAKRELNSAEFHTIGLNEPLQISAYHNLGIYDMVDQIREHIPQTFVPPQESSFPRLALVGRTNVGKSLLANTILGEDRAIVSEIAGTTRDSLDTSFLHKGNPMVLIDTAGIRKRGQVQKGIEKYSVLRALRAIERSDVSAIVMDASELATAQDAHVFGYAMDAFKGLIAVINKWDLINESLGTEKEAAIQAVRSRLHFMPYVPMVFTSGLTGQGVTDLLELTLEIYEERTRWIDYSHLRRVVWSAIADHPPASTGRQRVHIKEVRQVDINPPTFLLNANDPHVHFSYRRYLENKIRLAFDFRHTHLRLVFKRSS